MYKTVLESFFSLFITGLWFEQRTYKCKQIWNITYFRVVIFWKLLLRSLRNVKYVGSVMWTKELVVVSGKTWRGSQLFLCHGWLPYSTLMTNQVLFFYLNLSPFWNAALGRSLIATRYMLSKLTGLKNEILKILFDN